MRFITYQDNIFIPITNRNIKTSSFTKKAIYCLFLLIKIRIRRQYEQLIVESSSY